LGYDPFGRRIEKISPTSGTTIYAYDGDNVVEQLNASGSPTARFTQGPGIDEPLEVQIGRGNYYYSADGLGSVVALTKSNRAARVYSSLAIVAPQPPASAGASANDRTNGVRASTARTI
jgi:hypothetical protein